MIKKNLYPVSIDNQGYLLYRAPVFNLKSPSRLMEQMPVFGTRFASGDRNYTDLTFWWYWAQTDWSGGLKDETSWKDDAKNYYSTNIDALSEYGAIKLASGLTSLKDFAQDINCGTYGVVGASSFHFIGTTQHSTDKATIYRSSDGTTFTDVSSSLVDTYKTDVAFVKIINGVLWSGFIGTGTTNFALKYDGASFVDHSSDILGVFSGSSLMEVDSITSIASTVYLGVKGLDASANTGLKSAGGIGDAIWVTATNAYVSDNNYAWKAASDQYQVYKTWGITMGSTIPFGSTIKGIEVQIEGHSEGGTSVLYGDLSWDDGTSWTSVNYSATQHAGSSGDDTTVTLGGSADLWGHAWSIGETNDTYLQFKVKKEGAGTAYIDLIQIKVYYSTGVTRTSLISYTPSASPEWSEVNTWTGNTTIFDMINYSGKLYYLKGRTNDVIELRVYDPTTSPTSDALIQEFKCDSMSSDVGFNHYLTILGGSLIITIPYKEIWKYTVTTTTSSMERIWKRDDKKYAIGEEAVGDLTNGATYHDNKLWWGNLVYDGAYFFNSKKDYSDSTGQFLYPVYSDFTHLKWISSADNSILYGDSGYKGTANKNFLIFSQIDTISTIDKLFYLCNLNFATLTSGQKIVVKYSTDGTKGWTDASWVSLGSADYSIDGGTITFKSLYFPVNTVYKKIWLGVALEGGGSDTPTLQDISVAYYPLPTYKQRWNLMIECFDDLLLLDGKTREPKKGAELRNLLKSNWLSNRAIDFEDIDYAETAVNNGSGITASATTIEVDSTSNFPEQDILKIDTEQIKYTGRTATSFTGCTRGYDNTVATTHADDAAVSNLHKVMIINYIERTPINANAKVGEYIVSLEMIEL